MTAFAVAWLALPAAVTAADRAVVRGHVGAVDPAARQLTVRTRGGGEVVVVVAPLARLSMAGNPARLSDFRPGHRVRVTYTRDGELNRAVGVRLAVGPDRDVGGEVREAVAAVRGYTYRQKDAYAARLREVLDDVDDRIDDLRDRAAQAAGDAGRDLEARAADLERRREAVGDRLDRLRDAGGDAWDEFKAGVSDAAGDLGRALDDR